MYLCDKISRLSRSHGGSRSENTHTHRHMSPGATRGQAIEPKCIASLAMYVYTTRGRVRAADEEERGCADENRNTKAVAQRKRRAPRRQAKCSTSPPGWAVGRLGVDKPGSLGLLCNQQRGRYCSEALARVSTAAAHITHLCGLLFSTAQEWPACLVRETGRGVRRTTSLKVHSCAACCCC